MLQWFNVRKRFVWSDFLVRNNHSGLAGKLSSDMSEGDKSEALMGLGKFSMRYAY